MTTALAPARFRNENTSSAQVTGWAATPIRNFGPAAITCSPGHSQRGYGDRRRGDSDCQAGAVSEREDDRVVVHGPAVRDHSRPADPVGDQWHQQPHQPRLTVAFY